MRSLIKTKTEDVKSTSISRAHEYISFLHFVNLIDISELLRISLVVESQIVQNLIQQPDISF